MRNALAVNYVSMQQIFTIMGVPEKFGNENDFLPMMIVNFPIPATVHQTTLNHMFKAL